MQSFKDLTTWQEGHKLVLTIYKLTSEFPSKESYSLTDQIRRAVVSVTSNIAEGFGRQTLKEKVQFYYMAKGSLSEVHNQIIIAHDILYMDAKCFSEIEEQIMTVGRLLTGLINKTKQLSKKL
ncbi:four helix bundle protein [candidate division WWE3 bacterium CG_4_9_14_3_um_filter_39_7]|uniref:Four helix bundle protein n=1 Tax=candidate division WWE3 bacterium CG_4_9_14_3_um_filter_39_7 TaxID=1975080 RepID=A0A2M7WZN1_UNCKA|nr:MAG: four helix bundle protein [candidate division WWE3 bacterium CG_4_9_14_3_um_filter_39_7]